MIIAHSRRLQVLEVQEALKGIDTNPYIILEIQDIRTKLEELYKEAKESEVRTDLLLKQIE